MTKRVSVLLVIGGLLCGLWTAPIGCSSNNLGGDDAGLTDDGGTNPLSALASLTVTPATATLTVDNVGAAKTQAYTAIGHFSDGQPDSDVTSRVTWKLDNSAIGTLSGSGVFTTTNQAGGQGTITASSGTISATAQITVNFTPVISDPNAPATAGTILPATAAGTFMSGNSPAIVYPSANTMFPRNIYKILFNFTGGTGNDLWRLEFKSAAATVSVYTTSTSWTPTAQQWGYIANSNAGSKATLTIYGVKQSAPTNVYRSNPQDLYFSKNSVDGAIYYWSTTVAGVRRATVSDAGPQDFLTPSSVGKCVACHTVSRNGARVAADIGGSTLGVYNVKDRSTVIDPSTAIQNSWTTFNPDNSRIVTASKGILTLRNGDTGAVINVGGNNGVIPLAGKFGTMPDWAPDGKSITFAYSAVNKDRGISGSSIVTMQFANDSFSGMKVIVQSSGNSDSKYYPTFSPDSKWIAYVSAAGGNSDNNNAALLMLVPADGSAAPVAVAQANTIVNNATLTGTAAQLANTMPTWAPTQPGDTMFLAFTSIRAYANVYGVGKYKQLWVTGIDPAKLPGQDPSFPAFRLPFQGDTEDTHRPYWVVDVLAPPPPPPPPACAPAIGADCSATTCCSPNYCSSNNGGPPYTCQMIIG